MFIRKARRSRLRALSAAVGVAAAVTTAFAVPAHSLPSPGTANCPDTYPVADLVAHQPVDGLTVSFGNTPDTFTGEVLGVLNDGIAPGLDMILVRLTSSEIDRVGGIWAGMSGSPVYAADGRIIGAVSYGLAFGPSPVAGVTPAGDMKALVDGGAPAAVGPARHITLPLSMQRRLVSAGAATTTQASEGLSRLPLPVSVSGMVNSARLSKAASMLKLSDARLYRAGAAPAAVADTDIFPGSNLAGALSYGDFSAVGTGTTTMICNGQVIGFGHPFNWTGDSTMTMHGANAIYIQEDPLGAPFKVSNPTGPVGIISGDHLAGITGVVGQFPDTTLVHSIVSTPTDSRTGDTYVTLPDFLPDATALAELGNQDRVFDRVAAGSSLLHFTVDGTTSDGEPFTLVRTNRFASPYDISFDSIFELANDVAMIEQNDFKAVTIDEIRVSTQLSALNRVFFVSKVERKLGDTYTRLWPSSVVSAKAGNYVTLRVTLNSRRNQFGSMSVMLSVKVPSAPVGTFGTLSVGQPSDSGGEPVVGSATSAPTSFDGLLSQLANAPRNDQLFGQIDLFTNSGKQLTRSTAKLVHNVVQGGQSFQFRVRR
jgi:hypothetical protein